MRRSIYFGGGKIMRGLICLAAIACVCTFSYGVPTPIFEYRFNEVGNLAASTGSDHTPVTFRNSSFVTDLHSAAGLGVSSLPTDRAFDNTASTAMGGAGTGGIASTGITPISLSNLT